MEFENKQLEIKFSIPDKITVRQQLAYLSAAANLDAARMMERMWAAAVPLITEWECEYFNHKDSLDEATDTRVTNAIVWAALAVKQYINDLDKLPKN